MSVTSWMYLLYLSLSVGLTMWVATTLFRNGRAFLLDVFGQDETVADAVNRLLLVGFYLINLGYVCLALRTDARPDGMEGAIEVLAAKIGLVLVVLGVMHFLNLYVFARIRRGGRARSHEAPRESLLDAYGSRPPATPST